MARTLGNLVDDILRNIGRVGDPVATQIARQAVNMGVEIASLAFDIPENRRIGTITYGVGIDELLIVSPTKVNDIIGVKNLTDNKVMGFIPLEALDLIVPTGNIVRFYSRDGNALLVRPTPTKTTKVLVRYSVFPERLTELNQSLPFEGYDGYVLSLAMAVTWACFEETESAATWTEATRMFGVPYLSAMQARKVIEGIPELRELRMG